MSVIPRNRGGRHGRFVGAAAPPPNSATERLPAQDSGGGLSSHAPWIAPAGHQPLPGALSRPSAGDVDPPAADLVHRSEVRWTKQLVHLPLLLEGGLWIVQPLVLGVAINDALAGSVRGLFLFAVLRLAYVLARFSRQMADARRTAHPQNSAAVGIVPPTLDRVRRQWGIVTSVAGSLLLLAWYDPMLVPLCLLLLVPAGLLNAAFGRRSFAPDEQSGDWQSPWTLPLSAGAPPAFRRGDAVDRCRLHGSLVRAAARWRDREAERQLQQTARGGRVAAAAVLRAAVMELFVIGLLATTLVQYCSRSLPAAGAPIRGGDIVAVLSYILIFVRGVDAMPQFMRRGPNREFGGSGEPLNAG